MSWAKKLNQDSVGILKLPRLHPHMTSCAAQTAGRCIFSPFTDRKEEVDTNRPFPAYTIVGLQLR